MKIRNRHERTIMAPPGRVAALIADFGRIWPTQVSPAPRPQGHRIYRAGPMIWEEIDRPGAVRAFRVVEPVELQAAHWFDIETAAGATVLRHTVEGSATGNYGAICASGSNRSTTSSSRLSSTTSEPRPQEAPLGRPRMLRSEAEFRRRAFPEPARMLPVIQGECGGVIAGERVHHVNGPARRLHAPHGPPRTSAAPPLGHTCPTTPVPPT